jgi:NitT/TauT family transport system substrate-binding protein
MGYIPNVQFAPFYVAVDKGYYEKEGLRVNFKYGFESDLAKLVGTGDIPFMVGSGEEVILGRARGLPLVYVMRWYRKFPVVVFSLRGKGITKPKDLEGKKVGIPGMYGASYIGWKGLVYAAGIDEKKVDLLSIGYTQAAAVTSGQVDAALDYSVSGPVQLRLEGKEVNVIPVSDYIDIPSNGIITSEKVMREHPDLVKGLVQATLHGLRDTLNDPDEAFRISLKYVPEAGKDESQKRTNRAVFDAALDLWRGNGKLGESDPVAWQKTVEFMKSAGLIEQAVDAGSCYSNDFVR